MFGEDSTTLSKMYHLIDSVDITRTVCNFLQRTKLIYFFKYLCIYIYIYIYMYIYIYDIYIYNIYIYNIYDIYIYIYMYYITVLLFYLGQLIHFQNNKISLPINNLYWLLS